MAEEPGNFHAIAWVGVVPGICVVIAENADSSTGVIVYAGPIQGAPINEGATVLLSEQDFAYFCQRDERAAARKLQ